MTHSAPNRRTRLAIVAAGLALLLAACTATGGASPAPSDPAASAAAPSAAAAGPCPTAQPDALPAGETRTVTITTDLGDIVMTLDADQSPIAVGNVVALAECGFYDGVVFHRVVPGFVIQGGDGEHGRVPNVNPALIGTGGPGYTIADEPVTSSYGRGVVAMARSSAPNSVGSQFFIVLDDAAEQALASYNTYQIIGSVTSGMEVADAIAAAADQEIPTNPVVMTDVSVAP
jgi:cyclophilin family peptidyl-prolyl cis-trans isomerase